MCHFPLLLAAGRCTEFTLEIDLALFARVNFVSNNNVHVSRAHQRPERSHHTD